MKLAHPLEPAMLEYDPKALEPGLSYKLLIGSVVPRPIALVATTSADGHVNLAPFSYFTVASHAPMSLLFSVSGRKPGGADKDTFRNIDKAQGGTGEFVVNVVTQSYASQMAKTAATLPYGASEFAPSGLHPLPSKVVRPPRVAEAPVAFECRVSSVTAVGVARVIIGEVVHLWVRQDVLDAHGRIDPDKLGAVGRMAGSQYTRTHDRFTREDEAFFPR